MLITNNLKYRVSAVVSAFNSEKYIFGRLQNLIDQTLYQKKQLEIIVVDSCSQQNEGHIVKKIMQRYNHIVYVRTLKRESVYGAWNRGVGLANGKYIINANTDDRFANNALELMSDELIQMAMWMQCTVIGYKPRLIMIELTPKQKKNS